MNPQIDKIIAIFKKHDLTCSCCSDLKLRTIAVEIKKGFGEELPEDIQFSIERVENNTKKKQLMREIDKSYVLFRRQCHHKGFFVKDEKGNYQRLQETYLISIMEAIDAIGNPKLIKETVDKPKDINKAIENIWEDKPKPIERLLLSEVGDWRFEELSKTEKRIIDNQIEIAEKINEILKNK